MDKHLQTKMAKFLGSKGDECRLLGMRKMLTLRDMLKAHVCYKVENGESVNCLHDKWSVNDRMMDVLSSVDISALNMLPMETVAAFIRKVRWPKGRRYTDSIQICKNSLPQIQICKISLKSNLLGQYEL
ncbi:hypothetical protein LIER_10798 [Lithospermum erythrorhizon]|uniref:Uncharacterized protein n=1 Tax=Lithospermum erythrorhizon TaxID=34254 RepID=A0AAV3PQ05_LITER